MPFGKKKSQQGPTEFEVGPSIQENRTRSRKLIVAGLLLAVVAGVGSYVLLTRAQQAASNTAIPQVTVVVAARTITARAEIVADDLKVRSVPMDTTNAQGTFQSIDQVVGRTSGVTILQGQLVTSNLFAFSAGTAAVAILDPGESITPDSPDWRAISISVPDDRAVGGVLAAGEHVDIFVTTMINVGETLAQSGQYYGDKSTKVAYQDIPILSKSGTFYVIKVTERVAEEIAHLQASGNSSFSFALRPETDTRAVDATKLGATTNIIIQRYQLPVPQVFPQPGQAVNAGPDPNLPAETPAPVAVQPSAAPSSQP
jgi:Flp pilus assembly protein CpaB